MTKRRTRIGGKCREIPFIRSLRASTFSAVLTFGPARSGLTSEAGGSLADSGSPQQVLPPSGSTFFKTAGARVPTRDTSTRSPRLPSCRRPGVGGGQPHLGQGFSSPPASDLDKSRGRCREPTSSPFSLATHDSISDPPRSVPLSCVLSARLCGVWNPHRLVRLTD